MVEWHLPPDHIVTHWTHELLNLMIEKMVERKERMRTETPQSPHNGSGAKVISDAEMFAHLGIPVRTE